MPGIMSSYSSCMMPRMPILGCCSAICLTFPSSFEAGSALPVHVLVALVQGVDVGLRDGQRLAQRAGEVHRTGRVLAHHGGLDGGAPGRPDREDAVAAHEHRRRAMALERGHDALADVVPADAGE